MSHIVDLENDASIWLGEAGVGGYQIHKADWPWTGFNGQDVTKVNVELITDFDVKKITGGVKDCRNLLGHYHAHKTVRQ